MDPLVAESTHFAGGGHDTISYEWQSLVPYELKHVYLSRSPRGKIALQRLSVENVLSFKHVMICQSNKMKKFKNNG